MWLALLGPSSSALAARFLEPSTRTEPVACERPSGSDRSSRSSKTVQVEVSDIGLRSRSTGRPRPSTRSKVARHSSRRAVSSRMHDFRDFIVKLSKVSSTSSLSTTSKIAAIAIVLGEYRRNSWCRSESRTIWKMRARILRKSSSSYLSCSLHARAKRSMKENGVRARRCHSRVCNRSSSVFPRYSLVNLVGKPDRKSACGGVRTSSNLAAVDSAALPSMGKNHSLFSSWILQRLRYLSK
mmetsp:Transcript_9721/g.35604  ORF Transcript_9721/g.35604 Transcript_9721/m.35604 type:complete len:240 (-) Transcript_9721:656-1375(-)